MLELQTRKELATHANTFAASFKLVRYNSVTYLPVDFETLEFDPPPKAERTIWQPLSRERLKRIAGHQFQILFASDSELNNFDFMVAQSAKHEEGLVTSLLVRTDKGLRLLTPEGKLTKAPGTFVPNTILPPLNTDKAEKARVLDVIEGWVDSEEEARSLLHHLATTLAPGWSAVKYVILLGEGRNGKSLLLKMLSELLGRENISTVTRQQIAEQNPVVCELNGKLLNTVFDGRAEYLKDSGTEKSLIAGETVPIRRLYESTPTLVRTNALFIEGLNKEPKSNDKSVALQKRIVRFQFPNVYNLDLKFEKQMLKPEALGAFLSLLIDHYVTEEQVASKLAPTAKAIELQLEHMYTNSLAMQFLKYVEENDTLGTTGLLGTSMQDVAKQFQSWRVHDNDLSTWTEADVIALFNPLCNTERKSIRVNGAVRKTRILTSFKLEARAFIDSLEGADDVQATLVADR